jgi:hypothetical protein
MRNSLLFSTFLFMTLFFSCNKESNEIELKNQLVGTWYLDKQEQINMNEQISTYVRVTDNVDMKTNLFFEESNKYLQRTPMLSFCATPPISFITLEGKWQRSGDEILLEGNNQTGVVNYRIIFIDNKLLKIKSLN